MSVRILTIGHSTRAPEAFLDLLAREGVACLVDVRTVPRSRRVPWADVATLPALLAARGIAYTHLAALGGLRKALADSPNGAWRNDSFRGYADHMQSDEFARGIEELVALAGDGQVCIMCAEAVPWRCHRSLIADALMARGIEVGHIMDDKVHPAKMTPFAKVRGERVTYPPAGGEQSKLVP